jgi:hypothetical protein
MPPSRQTLANRKRDLDRLRVLAGETFRIHYLDRDYGHYGRFQIDWDASGLAVFGPARFEVAYAFLLGYQRGLQGRP